LIRDGAERDAISRKPSVSPELARLARSDDALRGETEMSRTKASPKAADTESQARARRWAQEAVQEAMDRRDNGGDAATATDN
jgi:hypothetical protein